MTISLKLIESTSQIAQNINLALASEVNSLLFKRKGRFINQIRDYVGMWVRSQPEMISLGLNYADPESLAGHFGLPYGSGREAVNAISMSIQAATEVYVKKFDKNLRGGIELRFQPSNFGNLLALPQGHVRAEIADLHWLRWLLESGNSVIVVNYHYSPEGGFGRSKSGIMRQGGAWRVPPQYAGTANDNFITRAFSYKEKELTRLFARLLEG